MIVSYLKHLLRAGNAHSVHSPFVFDLYTKGICSKTQSDPFIKQIERLRQILRKDDTEIDVLDLGAGSRTNNSNRRKISTIARNAEKPARFGQLFFRLTQYFQPANILELGTSLGITTAYFSAAAPESRIITFEGCPETNRIAGENFQKLGIQNIERVVGNIDQTLPDLLGQNIEVFDMVFFDANHRLEPTVRYFELLKPHAGTTSVFIFDDIYWSSEMKQAWEYIRNQPDVTVTIDLFWVGLVFFRKEQLKENFVLRF